MTCWKALALAQPELVHSRGSRQYVGEVISIRQYGFRNVRHAWYDLISLWDGFAAVIKVQDRRMVVSE
jgi:hypothetical protein